ncbi:hypothetical protein DPMN_090335 [Dreissena polymorpha]|uniref:Uncharacterized protein n=1 Tax=Dreissena polymorpha TaxID=45954 RepID=A0A9D4KYJ6_DREPO|nr:hypothetical protein DPMN_090335 [Dreissena polymorpha]
MAEIQTGNGRYDHCSRKTWLNACALPADRDQHVQSSLGKRGFMHVRYLSTEISMCSPH